MDQILKPVHARQDGVIRELIELSDSIKYYRSTIEPALPEMSQGLVRDYKKIYRDDLQAFARCQQLMSDNAAVFNEVLSAYNLDVTKFLQLVKV